MIFMYVYIYEHWVKKVLFIFENSISLSKIIYNLGSLLDADCNFGQLYKLHKFDKIFMKLLDSQTLKRSSSASEGSIT
jgi:hypothetical protein